MARSIAFIAKNVTGSTISAGKAVRIVGFDETDQVPTIDLASFESDDTMPAIGVIIEDLENGDTANLRISGLIGSIDTISAEINQDVFVGASGALLFKNPLTRDNSSIVSQKIGTVVRVDTEGQIVLFPMEIEEFIEHKNLPDLLNDDHKIYSLVNGNRPFTKPIGGITPTLGSHLATKAFAESLIRPTYISTTILSASIASSAEFDVFQSSNYSSFIKGTDWDHNAAPRGITYTPNNGRFTVNGKGTYEINVPLFINSTTSQLVTLTLVKNGSTIWTAAPFVDSTADPAENIISIIEDCAIKDFFEVRVNAATSNINIEPGTTFNASKIIGS